MSEVLVDTSAWIDYLNDESSPYGTTLDYLLAKDLVCTCFVVQCEVLSAMKAEDQFLKYSIIFDSIPRCHESSIDWPALVYQAFLLKRKGISGIGVPDLMIAQLAIQHHKTVFTKDKDFERMAPIISLHLLDLP